MTHTGIFGPLLWDSWYCAPTDELRRKLADLKAWNLHQQEAGNWKTDFDAMHEMATAIDDIREELKTR